MITAEVVPIRPDLPISGWANTLACLLLSAAISGCAAYSASGTPSPLPLPKVVATPTQDRVTLLAVKAKPVGDILPMYVSIANGTSEPVIQSQREIFVSGADGNRVPSVPLSEATVQAGGAVSLVTSLKAAAAYGYPLQQKAQRAEWQHSAEHWPVGVWQGR